MRESDQILAWTLGMMLALEVGAWLMFVISNR